MLREEYICGFLPLRVMVFVVCCLRLATLTSYNSILMILEDPYPGVRQNITGHVVKWRAIRSVRFISEACN